MKKALPTRPKSVCVLCHKPIADGSECPREPNDPAKYTAHAECAEIWQEVGHAFEWIFPRNAEDWAEMVEVYHAC